MDCDLLELHQLFGKKWTYGLLHNIDREPKSYNDLHQLTGKKINPTLLSERLQALGEFNLIKREENDRNVLYSITGEGEKLKELFLELKKFTEDTGCSIPEKCQGRSCEGCSQFRRIENF